MSKVLCHSERPIIFSFVNTFFNAPIIMRKRIFEVTEPKTCTFSILAPQIINKSPTNVSDNTQIASNIAAKKHFMPILPSNIFATANNVKVPPTTTFQIGSSVWIIAGILNCHNTSAIIPINKRILFAFLRKNIPK